MKDVRLCIDCKYRHAVGANLVDLPCGAYPDAKRLKDARDQCGGNDWKRKMRTCFQPQTRATTDRF